MAVAKGLGSCCCPNAQPRDNSAIYQEQRRQQRKETKHTHGHTCKAKPYAFTPPPPPPPCTTHATSHTCMKLLIFILGSGAGSRPSAILSCFSLRKKKNKGSRNTYEEERERTERTETPVSHVRPTTPPQHVSYVLLHLPLASNLDCLRLGPSSLDEAVHTKLLAR